MGLDRAPWNFNFSHVYVTPPSAGRYNVLLCEVSHQIMRHDTWLQGQCLQNYLMAKKCILCTVTFSILLFIGDACSVLSCTEHFAWNTLKQKRLRMEEVGVIMEQEDASLVRLVGTITIGNWPK